MKLYATTTSERASKGQGGNKFITVEITANKQVIALIKVFPSPVGQITKGYDNFIVQWLETNREGKETGIVTHGDVRGVKQEQKGKSQKGEKYTEYYCQDCDIINHDGKDTCPDCGGHMGLYSES